jgi:uncharacterized membrane protein
VSARTRLAVSFVAGLLVGVPAVVLTGWDVGLMLGWDTSAMVFVGSVILDVHDRNPTRTREMATREDNSRAAAAAIVLSACVASLVGVGFTLIKAAHSNGVTHGLITAVAVLSVVMSWAAVHTVYTLHYARIYYRDQGGIDWHADDKPHYGDFAYVALTIGMTFQVSDTDLVSKAIRMTALRHALLSYLFGVVVVAMTINVVAGLLAK